MIDTVLGILLKVADIVDKDTPGFAAKVQGRINTLKEQYANEEGKSFDQVDAALLDSLNLELRNIGDLFNIALQSKDSASRS